MTKHNAKKAYRGVEVQFYDTEPAPDRGRLVDSFTSRPLYLWRRSPRYTLDEGKNQCRVLVNTELNLPVP